MILLDAQSAERLESRKEIDNKCERQLYFDDTAVFYYISTKDKIFYLDNKQNLCEIEWKLINIL